MKSCWMHVKSIGNCEDLHLYALGLLRYNGDMYTELTDPGYAGYPSGKVRETAEGRTFLCLTDSTEWCKKPGHT
jgi:hypothetical protein